jgi:hypothetical protein
MDLRKYIIVILGCLLVLIGATGAAYISVWLFTRSSSILGAFLFAALTWKICCSGIERMIRLIRKYTETPTK